MTEKFIDIHETKIFSGTLSSIPESTTHSVYRQYNPPMFTFYNFQIHISNTPRKTCIFQHYSKLKVAIENPKRNEIIYKSSSTKGITKYDQKTRYNVTWEREFEWIKPSKMSEYYALCTFCKQYFKIDGTGRPQVLQHFRSQKHSKIEHNRKRPSSLRTTHSFTTTKTSKLNKDEELINAEIVWTLKITDTNCSFNTNDNYCRIFETMFPDSLIARNIDLSRTKMKYIAQFGIVPYIEKTIKTDLQGSPFSFLFVDSFGGIQTKKQFDCYVQFWSSCEDKFVPSLYVGSVFIGHCRADILKMCFFTFVKKFNLDCALLLHVGIDGLNLNVKFHRLLTKELEELHFTSLLDIGVCNVHFVGSALKKGLSYVNFPYESFMNDLIFYFKDSNDKNLELIYDICTKFFSAHPSTKWLVLKSVFVKILENYSCLKDFFFVLITKQENFKREIEITHKYKSVTKILRDRKTLIYINFLIQVTTIFENLATKFQKHEPCIHLWYDFLSNLLFDLMSNFLKHNVLFNKGKKLGADKLNQIDCRNRNFQLQNVVLNLNTKREIDRSSLNAKIITEIRGEFLQFYIESVSLIQKKLPLNSVFLEDVTHLQSSKKDVEAIGRVCRSILNVIRNENVLNRLFRTQGKDKNGICDLVIQQAKQFMLEKDVHQDNFQEYWKHIGQITDSFGEKKYLQLYILVKCVTVLNHGSSASERGFVINKRITEKNKNVADEETVCVIRLIKDYLNYIGGIEHFVVNKELIKSVKVSQKRYNEVIEKKKKKFTR